MEIDQLQQWLQQCFTDALIQLDGDGRHFDLVIVAKEFIGKSRVGQQQLVYQCLEKAIADGSLHAISMKTYTPEQWAAMADEQ